MKSVSDDAEFTADSYIWYFCRGNTIGCGRILRKTVGQCFWVGVKMTVAPNF